MIKTQQFKGVRYFYEASESFGEKPLIYLGGAFQGIADVRPITRKLAQYGPVITMDLPGFGQADLLNEHYPFDFYAELLENFLYSQNIDQVGIMGASYGSAVAYLLAAENSKVTSLTLAGTMRAIPDEHAAAIEQTITLLQAGEKQAFAELVCRLMLNQQQRDNIPRAKAIQALLYKALLRLDEFDQQKYIANSRRLLDCQLNLGRTPMCKTLVFTGEFDSFTRPEYCWEVAQAIPEAKMALIKNADHMFHIEALEVAVHLMAAPHIADSYTMVPGAEFVSGSEQRLEPLKSA